jgi:molybdate transport system substrate-binding protein
MRAVSLALLALVSTSCSESAATERKTMVFAAASLTAPFEALAMEFEGEHADADLELHFAGTPQLVLQIREGAPADVFASADEANMRKVVDDGRVAGAPRVFARNRLAIVTRKGNPKGIRALADLAREDLSVVLCGRPRSRRARSPTSRASRPW